MRHVLVSLLLAAPLAYAADQTILGTQLLVKNPSTPDKRLIVGKATESSSTNTIVGDPVGGSPGGAILTVRAEGDNPTSQTFSLPQGTSSLGKPFWSGDAAKGYKYKDSKGDNGPVKQAQIKKSGSGTFSIKFKVQGKLGAVNVLPPDDGTGGCALLSVNSGDSYSVRFFPGDGLVTNKGALLFKVKNPTGQGTCFTTTTTSTSSSTSITSTTSSTTITSTSTTTSTTIDCTLFAGPSYPAVCGNNSFSFTGNPGDPGGRTVNYFGFSPASGWNQLYWGVYAPYMPSAGLDGFAHTLSFGGISGGDTVVTWNGTSGWTDPSGPTFYPAVPIRLTITAASVLWVDSTTIPGLDPGLGTGIGAVVDIAPGGTPIDYSVVFEFTADLPTDGPGNFIPASTVPGTSGLLITNFSGGFYSQR